MSKGAGGTQVQAGIDWQRLRLAFGNRGGTKNIRRPRPDLPSNRLRLTFNIMATVSTPSPGVLALEGEIDLHEAPNIKESLQPLISAKSPLLIVDLSGVTYIDSSGLALFIETMQRVQGYGGKFALCGLRPGVKTIFEIARLDQVFRIFPDRDAAIAG